MTHRFDVPIRVSPGIRFLIDADDVAVIDLKKGHIFLLERGRTHECRRLLSHTPSDALQGEPLSDLRNELISRGLIRVGRSGPAGDIVHANQKTDAIKTCSENGYEPQGSFDLRIAMAVLSARLLTSLMSLERIRQVLAVLLRFACRPASLAEAKYAVVAARQSLARLPLKTACLETSLAAVIYLAVFCRVGSQWAIGVRCAPLDVHAWVEVDGIAVAEPSGTVLRMMKVIGG